MDKQNPTILQYKVLANSIIQKNNKDIIQEIKSIDNITQEIYRSATFNNNVDLYMYDNFKDKIFNNLKVISKVFEKENEIYKVLLTKKLSEKTIKDITKTHSQVEYAYKKDYLRFINKGYDALSLIDPTHSM